MYMPVRTYPVLFADVRGRVPYGLAFIIIISPFFDCQRQHSLSTHAKDEDTRPESFCGCSWNLRSPIIDVAPIIGLSDLVLGSGGTRYEIVSVTAA